MTADPQELANSVRAALRIERRQLRDMGNEPAASAITNFLLEADDASVLRLRDVIVATTN